MIVLNYAMYLSSCVGTTHWLYSEQPYQELVCEHICDVMKCCREDSIVGKVVDGRRLEALVAVV
jgi:hypothetical protein